MRSSSILALCIVAASAKAYTFDGMKECVQDELRTRVNAIVDEVNDRLDKISAEGGDAVSKARYHLKEKSDAFKNALAEPLKQARADYDECLRNTDRVLGQVKCFLVMGHDVMTEVMPIVSEKTTDLALAINEIAGAFRDNRKVGSEDLRSKARDFGKCMFSALRECIFRK